MSAGRCVVRATMKSRQIQADRLSWAPVPVCANPKIPIQMQSSQLLPPLRSLTLAATIAAAFLVSIGEGPDAEATPAPAGNAVRVVIDAGHGGSDPGAIGNGITEKVINLEVALLLRDLLILDTTDTNGGGTWEVLMTRTTDQTVSLAGRVAIANNWPADRFVSIHHNAFSSSAARGTETFSFANGTTSATVRDFIQDELIAAHGLVDRGPKTANFFVLRETFMPAALSETGFLTSPIDAAVLSAPGASLATAIAHLYGLQRSEGFAPYLPSPAPTNYCVPKITSLGCVPIIGATGSASLTSGDMEIFCDQVVSQQFGLMVWSRTQATVPFFGGTLCLGGSLVRTPATFSAGFGPMDCSGRLGFDADAAFLQAAGLASGEEVFAQWWFRDPGSAEGVGLSNGLRFTVLP